MVKYDLRITATITDNAAYIDLTTYIRSIVSASDIHQEYYDTTNTSNKARIVIHSSGDPTTLRGNIKTKLDTMGGTSTCTYYEIRTHEFPDPDNLIVSSAKVLSDTVNISENVSGLIV